MVLSVCLNPTIQRTLFFDSFQLNEVNRATEQYVDASGKGINLTRVLTQLDSPVIHLTHLSGSQKQLFLSLCKKDKLNLVYADSRSEIRTCTTVIDSKTLSVTELVEEGAQVGENTENLIRKLYEKEINKCTIVVLSGTKASGYSDDLFPWMTQLAKNKGKITVLDIKGKDLINSLTFKPDWIKPNMFEFIQTFNISNCRTEENETVSDIAKAYEKASELCLKFNTKCILTRGKHGAEIITSDYSFHSNTENIKAVNTIGCGDAFTAGFIHALPVSNTIETVQEAVAFASQCAAKNALTKKTGSLK